jgi:hypothetical protein
MCQQWLSVAGLVLDVVGFLIIAFEWRHTYLHSVFLRETQVQEDHDRTKADEQGKNYEDSPQCGATHNGKISRIIVTAPGCFSLVRFWSFSDFSDKL